MSMPIIPPFAVAASYQNSQYATGTYTQGGSQVFSHLVSPPTSGVAAETAADSDAHAAGFTAAASVNEAQLVTLTGTPIGGTFTLSFGGVTTSAIAYNAAASAVQSALEALSSITAGDVSVAGSNGGPYTVTFLGDFAGTNVPALTANGTGLRKATAVVTTTTQGTGSVDEVQLVTLTGATGGTFKLIFSGQTTAAIAYNAAAGAVQSALQALSNIGSGNATVSGSAGGPYTVTFTSALTHTNVAQMTADDSTLTGATAVGVTVSTTTQGSGYVNQALLNTTRQSDPMRNFYDTASGNHF